MPLLVFPGQVGEASAAAITTALACFPVRHAVDLNGVAATLAVLERPRGADGGTVP